LAITTHFDSALKLQLHPIPALQDNYIWLLHDGTHALVVDPAEATPVQQALAERGLQLCAILITHHHADHTGGVTDLVHAWPNTEVFAPVFERMPDVPLHRLQGGQRINALGQEFEVLDVPGHTAGHIAYFCAAQNLVFSGDVLFSAGCGRIFEGTPAQMHASVQSLARLPANTRLCCTHEYTLSNLRFARTVEPQSAKLIAHEVHCKDLRLQNLPTVPSTIGTELEINPFLRCASPEVVQTVEKRGLKTLDELSVFAHLREWKNSF
jgi:hydroxyacylglutathione hydrolase